MSVRSESASTAASVGRPDSPRRGLLSIFAAMLLRHQMLGAYRALDDAELADPRRARPEADGDLRLRTCGKCRANGQDECKRVAHGSPLISPAQHVSQNPRRGVQKIYY